jgi:uncharacterized protein (DUF58 family)
MEMTFVLLTGTTARYNEAHVKVFEERELTMMVDISGSESFGSKNNSRKTLLLKLPRQWLFSHANNDKIGLILFSDQIELYIPPKRTVGRTYCELFEN